ncbi:MAG: cytochrome c oxidase subunit 3 family protein [Oscillochloris sp.]|nr:cytochrome c oxidase subunit 3 family protein [Oscillochloris sp.]
MAEAQRPAHVAHHFADAEQQQRASSFGMWIFLGTEVMLFGALFLGFSIYRAAFPAAFAAAASHLDLGLGTVNTGILLTSSLFVALAVHAAQTGNKRALALYLLGAMVLGAIFLGIKGVEYRREFEEGLVSLRGFEFRYDGPQPRQAQLFFHFYFAMTGLHALHMLIGIGVLGVLAAQAYNDHFSPEYYNPVEVGGLYWHFVDLVWVFLFPVLYLLR